MTTPKITADEPAYQFEDTTLYETHNPLTRAIRKLLNPVLKLFFNPNPLIRALNIQSRLNVEAAQREAERVQQQAEWNALHYEILQRMVTEVSRVSLEIQAMSLQGESLGAKVDFNERRVRGIEGALHQGRGSGGRETAPQPPIAPVEAVADTSPPEAAAPGEAPSGEGHQRRRRRRRRGRRGAGPSEATAAPSGPTPAGEPTEPEEIDDGSDDEPGEGPVAVTTEGEPIAGQTGLAFPARRHELPPVAAPTPEPEHPRADPVVTPPAAEPPTEPGPDDQ